MEESYQEEAPQLESENQPEPKEKKLEDSRAAYHAVLRGEMALLCLVGSSSARPDWPEGLRCRIGRGPVTPIRNRARLFSGTGSGASDSTASSYTRVPGAEARSRNSSRLRPGSAFNTPADTTPASLRNT